MAMGVYLALVIIFGFVVFIFWAKSAVGQQALKHSWGEQHSFKKRKRLARRHTGSSVRPVRGPRTPR